MFFHQIVNQKAVKEKLLLSVQQNRVSHSQLFLGPEGNGSLALALAFAQYINCEDKQEQDSCGKCPSCIKSQKMIHPDIHYSYPVIKTKSDRSALSADFIKEWREAVSSNVYLNLNDWLDHIGAENKQGNITADECRDIIHQLSFKTFESKHKVSIIWMAEQLGKEGNILLKLLEEPPDNTLLILIAENREQLLQTIQSRCQIISIPRLSDEDLMDVLMNQHEQTGEAATKIVRQSEGNYREVLRILNSDEDNQPELLKKWMQLLVSGNFPELVKWVEEVARIGREKQKSFFRYALEFFRECVMLQQAGDSYSTLMDEERRMATWFAQRMGEDDWQQIQTWFEQAHYHIERNAHPKILFMNLSLQLHKLIANKKLVLPAN